MRHLILLPIVALLTAPLVGAAQPASKTARVGYLSLNRATGDPRGREAFLNCVISVTSRAATC